MDRENDGGIVLEVTTPDYETSVHAVLGMRATVGRAPGADVVLASPTVGRLHAAFTREGSAVFVEDLGSPAGVVVDGARVTGRKALAPDTRVRIGDLTVRARAAGGAELAVTRAVAGVLSAPLPATAEALRTLLEALAEGLEAAGVEDAVALLPAIERALEALDTASPDVRDRALAALGMRLARSARQLDAAAHAVFGSAHGPKDARKRLEALAERVAGPQTPDALRAELVRLLRALEERQRARMPAGAPPTGELYEWTEGHARWFARAARRVEDVVPVPGRSAGDYLERLALAAARTPADDEFPMHARVSDDVLPWLDARRASLGLDARPWGFAERATCGCPGCSGVALVGRLFCATCDDTPLPHAHG